MATADEIKPGKVGPRIRVDERGKVIPFNPEELRVRGEAIRAALELNQAIRNPPNEDDSDFFRALDESHPGRFDLRRFYEDGHDPA